MDVLTDVLNSLRLSSTLYCQSKLGASWCLRFMKSKAAVFHVVQSGDAWMHIEGDDTSNPEPIHLNESDLIVLPHGTQHRMGNQPDQPPIVDIYLDRDVLAEAQRRDYTDGLGGASDTLLCGLFNIEIEPTHPRSHPLMEYLPTIIHFSHAQTHALGLDMLLCLLGNEADTHKPGSETVMRRLADILLIQVLRAWLHTEPNDVQGWLSALRDPQIGAALGLIHHKPEAAWSLEGLASEVAMSRSAFAARFATLVGEPPAQYLAHWRMRRAADLLQHSRLGMGDIAQRVGYESEVAFSKAFKRIIGVAPGAYRRRR